MYEQDYIMRQIQMLVQFVARAIFGRDKVTYESNKTESSGESDRLYQRVKSLTDAGDICAAEDALFEGMDAGSKNHLLIGIEFYDRLNNMKDSVLENANFSRDEIAIGLRDLLKQFGVVAPN